MGWTIKRSDYDRSDVYTTIGVDWFDGCFLKSLIKTKKVPFEGYAYNQESKEPLLIEV